MNKQKNSKARGGAVTFFICLMASIGLIVGGFFCPPMGIIDGSVLTAAGILLGFATLDVGARAVSAGAQAVAEGRTATIQHGDTSVIIGDNDTEE